MSEHAKCLLRSTVLVVLVLNLAWVGTEDTRATGSTTGEKGPPVVHRPWGHFPDTPLGHFWFYLEAKQPAKAEEVFRRLVTFRTRYKAATSAVYGVDMQAQKLAIRCAEMMLTGETDPHHRAAIYRILAQAHARLRHPDDAIESGRKAVQLNPRSPWGWYWLAEGYSQAGFYVSEASARKHELSLFAGDGEEDRRARRQICDKLGFVYLEGFRDPEKAISYFRRAGDYMNIIAVVVQRLHDVPRAQAILEEAKASDPLFLSHSMVREELERFGLEVGNGP